MINLLLDIADSTNVVAGHDDMSDQINILSVVIALLIVVGLILIIRYLISERIKKQ